MKGPVMSRTMVLTEHALMWMVRRVQTVRSSCEMMSPGQAMCTCNLHLKSLQIV